MIKPLKGYVLVKDVPVKETVGQFILAQEENKESVIGEVIIVSKSKKCQVHPADIIAYKKYMGHEISDKGEKYKLLHNDDIIAIIK